MDGAPTITKIRLNVVGDVPGLTDGQFTKAAEDAEKACLIARALAGVETIELSVKLKA